MSATDIDLPALLLVVIDRSVLTELAWEQPRGHVEELLAEVWSEVLEVEPVGRDDSFFDLGGSSVQAMRVAARVRARLGIEVDADSVLTADTLAEMAAQITR